MQCPACCCQRRELLFCGQTGCAVPCLLPSEKGASLWLNRLCSALPAAVREGNFFSVARQAVQCPACCCQRRELLLFSWTDCAVPCLLPSEKRAPLWRDRLCSALPAAVREASSFSVAGQTVQCPACSCQRSELLCGGTVCAVPCLQLSEK